MTLLTKGEKNKILAAGDDLVAAIEKANWGTIRHATLHMDMAIALWKEIRCLLQRKKAD